MGMSVNIKVVNLPQKKNKRIANLLMENENMNKIKVKTKYWHECQHS